MPISLLELSAELRNTIYEAVLLDPEPIRLESKFYEQRAPGCRLLRVNRQIHREANATFYAQNEFDVSDSLLKNISFILNSMGRNVALIHSFRLEFPHCYRRQQGGKIIPEGDCTKILSIVRSKCINVRYFNFCLYHNVRVGHESISTFSIRRGISDRKHRDLCERLLEEHAEKFRTFHKVQKVVIEVVPHQHHHHFLEAINQRGWALEYLNPGDVNALTPCRLPWIMK
ncbi:uncharacterized protein K489DRAFT_89320 [Dissoconium aciculare CBS 342.82]|uniref:Uncharacterized protein n=1 Tax=Dissoconium aciculare CBS 342.82 TaxID=1314786 RepID=A0A6J3LVS8_9PEZI|nr:uncharacterized protein K489DRAFT_89320 [Dissoconium aciculare CBS 342.82]KAF1818732.1 hypothetical protein K489DRAFT_89320 [Dissoconium aciculare CBS 342.82]